MTEEDLLAVGAQDLSREDARWVSLPVGEFENLHEEIRLLRAKIERLQVALGDYEGITRGAVAEAKRWRTVVADVHVEARGHRNPYAECPSAICVAARLGSRETV